MKKIVSLLVLVLGLHLQAQEQTSGRNENLTKGHHSFGVSSNALAFSKTVYKDKNSRTSSDIDVNLDLDVGYFIIDKLKLGLFVKVNSRSISSNKTLFSIGPGMTYYFTGKSNLTPYLLASGGYYKTKLYTYHESGYTIDFGAGAIFMINKTIGLNAHLLYDYKNGTQTSDLLYNENDPAFKNKFKITQSNLSFRIGFSIFL